MVSDATWICLGAGKGTRLRPITDDRPKPLVTVSDRPIVEWLQAAVSQVGIEDRVIVTGYLGDQLAERADAVRYHNPDYDTTNMVQSLWCAQAELEGPVVISYGDILYTPSVLSAVLESDHDIAVAVDHDWKPYWERRHDDPLTDAESLSIRNDRITSIGQPIYNLTTPDGQYIGLMKLTSKGTQELRDAYQEARSQQEEGTTPFGSDRTLNELHMTDLLQGLVDRGADVGPVRINGMWVEVDTEWDLEIAEAVCRPAADGTLSIDRSRSGEGQP